MGQDTGAPGVGCAIAAPGEAASAFSGFGLLAIAWLVGRARRRAC